MLQTVRKYTQGWVATVMGIILSFAFILWGIENYLSGNSKKNVAAKVNGKAIKFAEVNNDFQRMILRLKDQLGSSFSLPPTMQRELKEQALNNLIMQNVLTQSALNSGFIVTSQETASMIRQMPAFQEDGNFSKERFLQIINKMGYSQQEFVSDVSQTLLLNQVASGIVGSEFALQNEINQAIALMDQKRDIEYVIIYSDAFKKNIQISADQIKNYYQEHHDQFIIPAKVQTEYVQLSVDEFKKAIQVTDQEIKEYFDSNSNLDRKNSKAITKAKDFILQQKAEQKFLAASEKLADLAYTNPNSLSDAAKTLDLKIKVSEYFSKEGGSTLITKSPKVVATAFNSDLIKDRTNSNLIEIASGNVVVLRVKDYQADAPAPLKNVQDKIKQKLIAEEASAKAKKHGETFIGRVQSKDDFKKIATAEQLSIIAKEHIARTEKKLSPEILQLAFSISPAAKIPVKGMQLPNGDYAIVLMKNNASPSNNKLTSNQHSAMSKTYSMTYGKLDYNLYTENQMNKAKIKTYGHD